MSFNRENIVWESADGTWSRGFYEVVWQGEGDPEWDVEYGNNFSCVTTGHPTEDAACAAWQGANPGGYQGAAADEAAALDALAAACKASARKRGQTTPDRGWWYA